MVKRREPRPVGDGICEVDLTRGLVALIDESDAETVSICSWSAKHEGRSVSGYAVARIPGCKQRRRMLLHRLIMCFPLLCVDHINGNGLDNRRANLRLVTFRQNSQNQHSATGMIPYKGVHASRGLYASKIRIEERRIFLGRFPTAIEAALAYDAAAVRYFGEFAATNESLGLLGANE